jgi:hypothetical protein
LVITVGSAVAVHIPCDWVTMSTGGRRLTRLLGYPQREPDLAVKRLLASVKHRAEHPLIP